MAKTALLTIPLLLLLADPGHGAIAVSGRATTARGEAVPGATARLLPLVDPTDLTTTDSPRALATATADARGWFRLEAGEPGLYLLRLEAAGLAPMEHPLLPLVEDVVLPPAALAADAGLGVRVVDVDGAPVAGARVAGIATALPAEVGWRRAAGSGLTGPDGTLRLSRAAGDRLTVRAFRDGFGESPAIGLGPGEEAPLLRLCAVPAREAATATTAAPLAGRVVAAGSGEPVPGAVVWPVEAPWLAVRSGADGRFRLATVGDGEMAIAAAAPGFLDERRQLAPRPAGALPPIALRRAASAAGRVREPAGAPVPGAEVEVRLDGAAGPTVLRALSGPDGAFRLRLAPDRPHRLSVHKEGYGPAEVALVAAPPGPLRDRLEVVLRPGRPAFGVALDADGLPAHGAELALVSAGKPRVEARAGEDGVFRFAAVPTGTFALHARDNGAAPIVLPGIVVPAGPGTWDLGTVTLAPAAITAGRVVDPEGTPVAGAVVRALAVEDGEEGAADQAVEATAGEDGWFALTGLAPGRLVDLDVAAAGHARVRVRSVEVPPAEPLTIVLGPAASVTGTVTASDGRPVAGAVVRVSPDPAPGTSDHTSGSSDTSAGTSGGPTVGGTDEDGRFAIDGLASGRVRVSASASGYAAAREVEVDLGSAEEPRAAEVEIVLERGAALAGQVASVAGRPLPGAAVAARATAPDRRVDAVADDLGRYRLEGLAPGDWLVVASHPGHRRRVERVTVGPEGGALDLTLDAGAEVSGRVVDGQGEPVAGARLELRRSRDELDLPSPPLETLSDAAGSFRFGGVEDGAHELRAERPGLATVALPEPVEVRGAPVGGLLVRLESGGAVRGRLLGVPQEELARVEVAAVGSGRLVRGEVDFAGRYRLRDLAPGEWLVSATAGDGGRRAGGRVVVESGDVVELDLELVPATPGERR